MDYLEEINESSKISRYLINKHNSIVFRYTHSKQFENETLKAIPFTVTSKNKIPRN